MKSYQHLTHSSCLFIALEAKWFDLLLLALKNEIDNFLFFFPNIVSNRDSISIASWIFITVSLHNNSNCFYGLLQFVEVPMIELECIISTMLQLWLDARVRSLLLCAHQSSRFNTRPRLIWCRNDIIYCKYSTSLFLHCTFRLQNPYILFRKKPLWLRNRLIWTATPNHFSKRLKSVVR